MAQSPSRPRRRGLRLLLGLAALLVLGLGAGAVFFWATFLRDLPDFQSLEDYRPALTSVVLDREGRPIGEFFEQRRRVTRLEEIPPYVVKAFIAAEDDSFYEHKGIDLKSVLRAAWANLRAGGEKVQGASTITQQMVKQLLLSSERTYRRKIREMILARRIERRFTKDAILFLYLNEIYFGSGAYGVGEAAFTYFGKPVGELSVGEAALLAGLPKAPGRNSPTRNPERAEERRRYVLNRMLEEGFIDEASHDDAMENPPTVQPPRTRADFALAAYFTEEVRRYLVQELGNDLVLRGGLTVETTLDFELQRAATEALRAGLQAHDRRQGYRGPVRQVAVEDVEAEVARVAEENQLLDEDGHPAARLPGDRTLLGVVTSVSRKKKRARVVFAPGLEAIVPLDQVEWAWPTGAAWGSRKVRHIDDVFAVGDVTRFRKLGDADEADGGDARVTLHQEPETQGSLISMDVHSGEILALVGGYDFEHSEFNRAVQARRQPGSAFKPLIYSAALEGGYTPASILYDRPVVYDDPESGFTWRPENYGRRFLGPLTLNEALARSVNNATIHLLRDAGVGRVIRYAQRLGIESPLERNLSLALGASPVSLLELTRAYAVFPAGGYLVQPIFVRRVVDRSGEVLLRDLVLADGPGGGEAPPEAEDGAAEPAGDEGQPRFADGRVISPSQAYLSTDLLRGVVRHPRGTGRRARELRRAVAGKTGTTNEQGDAWFIGFSPDIVAGVWVGYDEKRVLGPGETGGRAALPIWLDFMRVALADRPARDFPVPAGIEFAHVDPRTGLVAAASAEEARFLAFAAGTAPSRSSEQTGGSTPNHRRRLRLDF